MKGYYELCTFLSFYQLIEVLTRIFPSRNSTFLFKKISRIKRDTHKQIKFCSFKHYSADLFDETVSSINFPNNQNLHDSTEAYNDFIEKIMVVNDKVGPIKERKIRSDTHMTSTVRGGGGLDVIGCRRGG